MPGPSFSRRPNFRGRTALAATALLVALGASVVGRYGGGLFARATRAATPLAAFVADASISDVRLCRCLPDRDFAFDTEGGVRIVGSVYGEAAEPRPTILLLHGNTPVGRRLPLYRVLATRLADAGFSVVVTDFVGFGESGDPYGRGPDRVLTRDEQVEQTIDALGNEPFVDGQRLFLVGHSMGAGSALRVGRRHPAVEGVVAIGPPRRIGERQRDAAHTTYMWERFLRTHAQATGNPAPQWITRESWMQHRLQGDMVRLIPHFRNELHKPLLFIDGDREAPADLAFLRKYIGQISEPKLYLTVEGSDHYANTESLRALVARRGCRRTGCRDPLAPESGHAGSVVYDASAVEGHVKPIADWIRGLSGSRNGRP